VAGLTWRHGTDQVPDPSRGPGPDPAPRALSAAAWETLTAEGRLGRVVDVRTPWEYARGHIPGAEHVPLSRLTQELAAWPKDAPITLVCLSGHRSARAGRLLARLGFTDVRHLAGGMLRWRGPIERTPPAR